MNVKQQTVQWKFVNVAAIDQPGELTDGCELYSEIKTYEQAAQYINSIHGKALQISNFSNPDWVQLL